MDIPNYLRRIGFDSVVRVDLDCLQYLQHCHMVSVPFENLDIEQGHEIRLDLQHLYDKIVTRRRGGFCYELNTLFGWLLSECGFDVTMLSARVYNEHGLLGPEFDHMTLLVKLDATYLVDVGFGNSFRQPLLVPDGSVRDISGRYWLKENEDGSGGYVLYQSRNGDDLKQYEFTMTPRDLDDYGEMCRYHQQSPESPFTRKALCTIATPNGRVSLTNDFLTVSEGTKQRKFMIHSREEWEHILQIHFGIELERAKSE